MAKAPFIVPRPAGVPEVVERLTAAFSAIPGVGEKTARRYALWFAMGDLGATGPAGVLSQVLTVMRAQVHPCPACRAITDTPNEKDHLGLCGICADPKREAGVLCVVATMQHMLAIEKSGAMRGKYLVLGKLLSPLEGVDASDLPLADLSVMVTLGMEVVLALPVTVEGDATAMVITRELEGVGARVTRIAAGMPHGGDIEHADVVTLGQALRARRSVE